jgi:sugar phosphate isomerase/epimerase
VALGRGDLVLCAASLLHVPFLERLEPARKAGFAGVSMTPFDYELVRSSGTSDAALRRRVADLGLGVAELDEGDFDLVGLPRVLGEIGCPAPIGVEIFSDALVTLPADEVARRCAGAAHRVLRHARSS